MATDQLLTVLDDAFAYAQLLHEQLALASDISMKGKNRLASIVIMDLFRDTIALRAKIQELLDALS